MLYAKISFEVSEDDLDNNKKNLDIEDKKEALAQLLKDIIDDFITQTYGHIDITDYVTFYEK